MFLTDLIFGNKNRRDRQTIQTFNSVPREEIAEYNFNKGRVRYEAGYTDSEGFQNAKNTFNKFVNNKPIEVLYAANAKKDIMFENVGKVAKKVLISEYEALCKKYQNSDDLYCDPNFLPNDQSLGKTFARNNITWKRVSQLIPNAEFVNDTICPEDILQGGLGNCYFLSAIAALAENDFRIKNIFPNLSMNKNGFYMARVLHLGVLQQVVVDDFIPVNKDGKALFAQPAGGKQIWVMILQKCWAKLYGSFQITVGGLPSEALRAFSGAPTFYNSLTQDKSELQALFESLLQANSDGAVLCCGTIADEQIQSKGLVTGHAYTILQVYQQPFKMLKIRNPWGNKEWNGRASEQDKQFWSKMKSIDKDKLGQKFGNDGIFFMLWEDFVDYFKMINICKVNDNANYFYYEDEYQNDTAKLFELETSGGQTVISLSQRNIREIDWKDRKKGYGTVTLIVSRVVQQDGGVDYEYVDSKKDSSFPQCSMLFKDLPAGKYVVSVSVVWTRGPKEQATVSVYTDSQIKLVDSKVKSQQFLYKVYLNKARNSTETHCGIFQNSKADWYCSDALVEKCGYGYFVLHLDKNSIAKKFILTVDEQEYNDMNMELLPPYKGKGTFKVTVQPGREVIILSRVMPGEYLGEFYIPIPKFDAVQ